MVSRFTYLHGNPKARNRAIKHYMVLAAGKVQHDQHIIDWTIHHMVQSHRIIKVPQGRCSALPTP